MEILIIILALLVIMIWVITSNINKTVFKMIFNINKNIEDINQIIFEISEKISQNDEKLKHHSDAMSDLYAELIKIKQKIK